jgi:hypothetical protein
LTPAATMAATAPKKPMSETKTSQRVCLSTGVPTGLPAGVKSVPVEWKWLLAVPRYLEGPEKFAVM